MNDKNLRSTFVVIDPQLGAESVPVTDTIWEELDAKHDAFVGHLLVSAFSFADDWPTWEMHPNGDEVVTLMSGDVEMILLTASGKEESHRLSEPGSFVVVPRSTWHTARVNAPTTMLFVTAGEGTLNQESPGVTDG